MGYVIRCVLRGLRYGEQSHRTFPSAARSASLFGFVPPLFRAASSLLLVGFVAAPFRASSSLPPLPVVAARNLSRPRRETRYFALLEQGSFFLSAGEAPPSLRFSSCSGAL